MKKMEPFWQEVAKVIEQKFGQGDVPQWRRSVVEEFLRHFERTLKPLIHENSHIAEACGGSAWKPIDSTTFEKIFKHHISSGSKTTRNAFAIYMGYLSFEDYTIKRKRKGAGQINGQIEKRVLTQAQKQKPIPVTVELPDADFAKEDENEEWMVYELAFLWHGKEPPSIQVHFYQMTREIEKTKANLHKAVENGLLHAKTVVLQNGVTRFVTRNALEEYIKNQEIEKPDFLRREGRVRG